MRDHHSLVSRIATAALATIACAFGAPSKSDGNAGSGASSGSPGMGGSGASVGAGGTQAGGVGGSSSGGAGASGGTSGAAGGLSGGDGGVGGGAGTGGYAGAGGGDGGTGGLDPQWVDALRLCYGFCDLFLQECPNLDISWCHQIYCGSVVPEQGHPCLGVLVPHLQCVDTKVPGEYVECFEDRASFDWMFNPCLAERNVVEECYNSL